MHTDQRRPQLSDDPVDVLVEAGLVDVDYVTAQTGARYASPEEAAQAVVEGTDISPHPLIEIAWLGRRRAWQRAGVHPIVWYLAVHRRRSRLATHPLVEPRQICADLPEARFHRWGALSYWLAHVDDETPLPTRLLPGQVTWGAYRAGAIAGAREWRATQARKRPRVNRTATAAFPPAPTAEGAVTVSVLMTCQDSAPRLRQTVASLQQQTTTDWELIVVDRGSRDDTLSVLNGLAAFEPRLRIVEAVRTTVGAAFNLGLEHVRADHVAFTAAGSEWTRDHLTILLGHARQADAALVHAGTGPVARSRDELLAGRSVDLSTWLMRRSAVDAIGGFDESLGGAAQHDLVLRISREHDLFPVDLSVDGTARKRPDRTHQAAGDDWTSVVLERQLVDWEDRAARPTDDSLISHVLPISSEPRGTIDWLHALPTTGVELVTVGVRLKRSGYVLSHALGAVLDRVTFVPVAADVNVNAALNLGITHAGGSTLVLVRPESMPPRSEDATRRLVAALDDDIALAQPVVLGPDGTIASAGARFAPTHTHPGVFLGGHPLADAQRMGTCVVSAPVSPMVAMRTSTATVLNGLCCRFSGAYAETDLALRAQSLLGGGSVVTTDAVISSRLDALAPAEEISALTSLADRNHTVPLVDVADHLRRAGFEVTDHRSRLVSTNPARLNAASVLVPEPVVRAVSGIHESPPRLRWTIDIAAPAAARGDRWGDTFFASSLAAALTRQGQDVAVDRRDSRHRDTRDHDDVLLVLRGLDRVNPRPGLLNLLWVISHPDMVTRDELVAFDAVYAASLSWPVTVHQRWGVPVMPLLQCTDHRLFNPERSTPGTGPEVVFIGNSRGVYRFAVRTALGAQLPLTLHGNDWHPFVAPHLVTSLAVVNDQVGTLYGSAGVVLNDHHLDMRRDSFLSNRLFDAAACGARVATDPVEGLDAIFGGAAQPFTNERELAALCTAPYAAFPDDATRREIAQRIVTEHSFDARAETLVAEAVRRLHARRS